MIHADERIAFDMFLASIVSMQFHPGAGTKEHHRLSIEECKDMALEMITARRAVLGES
jgi:hypothetical protein